MGNRADAEDVLQQALLVVSRKPDAVPLFNPWPWLAKVITFEARNARRRRAMRSTVGIDGDGALMPAEGASNSFGSSSIDSGHGTSLQLEDPKSENPIESMLKAELRTRLWAAYQTLPQAQREALGLVCLSGLSQRAAAKALGIPPSTLRLLVHEGLEKLRKELGLDSGGSARLALIALPLPAMAAGVAAGLVGATTSTAAGTAGGGTAATLATGAIAMKKAGLVAAAVLVIAFAAAGVAWYLGDGENAKQTPIAKDTTDQDNNSASQPKNIGGRGESGGEKSERVAPRSDVTPAEPPAPQPLPTAPKESAPTPTIPEPKPVESSPLTKPVRAEMSIHGRTIDASGAGVSAATITAEVWRMGLDENLMPTRLTIFTAQSNPDGTFELSPGVVDADCEVRMVATHTRLAMSMVKVVAGREGKLEGVTLELGWTGEVFGSVVRDRDGAIMVGSTVQLEFAEGAQRELVAETKTGPEGEFHFRGLKPGMYFLMAKGRRLGSLINSAIDGLPRPGMQAGKMVRITEANPSHGPEVLRLPSFNTLSFRLAAPARGTVHVALSDGPAIGGLGYGHWGVPLDPDDQGNYRADWLRGSHRQLAIKANGFALTNFKINPIDGEDLDLGVLELSFGKLLRGRVEDDAGRGIAGALLEVEVDVELPFQAPAGTRIKQPKGSAISTDDGSFTMEALAVGSYELYCRHQDYGVVRIKLAVMLQGDPRPITIVMPRAGVVFGVVPLMQDVAGQTPSATTTSDIIALVPVNEDRLRPALQVQPGFMRFLANGSKVTGPIAEDGSYELSGVAPGTYHVIALRGGFVTMRAFVTVAAGSRTRVDFDWVPDECTISGRVTEKDGGPVAGIKVSLTRNPRSISTGGQVRLESTTDANGDYTFTGLLPGNVVVLTGRDPTPYTDEFITTRTLKGLARAAHRMDIELPGENCALTGRATLNGEAKFTHVSAIAAGKPSSPKIGGEIDTSGNYRVALTAPGVWQLLLELREPLPPNPAFGGLPQSRNHVMVITLEVPDGGLEHHAAISTGSLSGRVTLPTGTAAIGARVTAELTSAPGIIISSDRVKEDGTYRLPLVQEAEVRVTVTLDTYVPSSQTTTISGNTTLDLNVGGKGGTIEVAIASVAGVEQGETKWLYAAVSAYALDASGNASPTAAATMRAAWRPGYNGVTKLQSLAPGRYKVVIGGPVEEWTTVIEVLSDAATRIEPALTKRTE